MGSVSKLIKKSPTILQRLYYKIIPFSIRYGKDFRNLYSFLDKSQWWDTKTLQEFQLEKLNQLLEYSYENVPYYKNVFDERGIRPKDIQSISDLSKLPILTRNIINDNYKDLISENVPLNQQIKFSTSGSTGNPLTFLGNNYMYKAEAAFITRAFDAHDSKLYKEKTIWLRRYVPSVGKPIFKYDYELNRLYLSAYHLSKNSVSDYVDLINNYGAKTLVGYPSSLYILALLLEEVGLKLNNIKVAHAGSEKVLEEWKTKIETVLGIPLKTHYGMMEKVSMFFQCSHSDYYHESLEYGVTEFLDGGNVVGTGFMNSVMPFIRYQMNDCAVVNKEDVGCTCGRGLPLTVLDFEGRSDDIIITKDGRYLPGVNFYTMMYKVPGVKMFQIIQHTKDDIEVKIVMSDKFTEESTRLLRKGLLERVGAVNLDINFVEEIDRSLKTGKIRCIYNECLHDKN